MMWKGWVKREDRERVALDFWDACKAQDARIAAAIANTEYLWRRPGSPTMDEHRHGRG
jgi:hypothetical protein